MTDMRRRAHELWIRLFGRGPPQPKRIGEFVPPISKIDPRTLEQGLYQVEMLKRSGFDLKRKTLLNIGTGWQPTIPLVFHLAGCGDIILVDHERVLDRELLVQTATNLRGYAGEIAKRLGMEKREVVQRLRVPADVTLFGALRQFHMQYLAPYDLIDTPFPDNSIDLVIARAPLAHYTTKYVKTILPAIGRLLRHDGLMSLCFEQNDRLDYLELLRESSCRLVIEESDTELRVVTDGEAPERDPTRSLAFLIASCMSSEQENYPG
ncbi:class I SAM-dependent methyltransferase [bacterium]|nr:class I SAM-dependent methyltransferase [bacterium]MBU1675053.1 class I SAM-dependent methyltransferase [bacterium]